MNEYIEKTYWIAIAHLPKWHTERINRLIVHILHEKKMSWPEFFELNKKGWHEIFAFTDKELSEIETTKNDLSRLAFIAEQLQNEGFQIITINSRDYPSLLKENLKIKNSPPVLYVKGRKGLLYEDAVAIIGSRKAGKTALDFTDNIAKKSVKESKVVISGFAKGVDKQALDSTISAKGKSIIVLPQGILTFQSGFRKYYESIVNGDSMVLSTFFPKAGWDVGLAMARNIYIYGLAKEIYVAESDSKGGTWEGAMDGLKRHRQIYVRIPEPEEKNANLKLIELGALPVNMDGVIMISSTNIINKHIEPAQVQFAYEPELSYDHNQRNIEKEILEFLRYGTYTSKEVALALKIDWESRKMNTFLKKNPNIKTIAGKPAKYTLNDVTFLSLFD